MDIKLLLPAVSIWPSGNTSAELRPVYTSGDKIFGALGLPLRNDISRPPLLSRGFISAPGCTWIPFMSLQPQVCGVSHAFLCEQ